MNKQEIFDTVARHLLTQNRRSAVEVKAPDWVGPSNPTMTTCQYRAPNGDKCAAGVLIPDAVYKPEMEGNNISAVARDWEFFRLPAFSDSRKVAFIRELQAIHDGESVASWPSSLSKFARQEGLSDAVIGEFHAIA